MGRWLDPKKLFFFFLPPSCHISSPSIGILKKVECGISVCNTYMNYVCTCIETKQGTMDLSGHVLIAIGALGCITLCHGSGKSLYFPHPCPSTLDLTRVLGVHYMYTCRYGPYTTFSTSYIYDTYMYVRTLCPAGGIRKTPEVIR